MTRDRAEMTTEQPGPAEGTAAPEGEPEELPARFQDLVVRYGWVVALVWLDLWSKAAVFAWLQEPGTELEIKKFCTDNYSVTFPLHSKIEVNGKGAHPLYKKLKKESGGSDKIGWNFEKFLLDGNGKVIKRFSPRTKPDAPEVIAAIEMALK